MKNRVLRVAGLCCVLVLNSCTTIPRSEDNAYYIAPHIVAESCFKFSPNRNHNKLVAIQEDQFLDNNQRRFAQYRLEGNGLPPNTSFRVYYFSGSQFSDSTTAEFVRSVQTDENGVLHIVNDKQEKMPIKVVVDASDGAKSRFVLQSIDRYTYCAQLLEVTPNPIIKKTESGACIELSKLERNCNVVLLEVTGLKPQEELKVTLHSNNKEAEYHPRADNSGRFALVVDAHLSKEAPVMEKGKALVSVIRDEKVTPIEIFWSTKDWKDEDVSEYARFKRVGVIHAHSDSFHEKRAL